VINNYFFSLSKKPLKAVLLSLIRIYAENMKREFEKWHKENGY
jgi:hypothetical protein